MIEKVPMTPAGQARLREEVAKLRDVERPKISKEIGIAREHGDLRENAEYHAAKEKQGFIEGRIKEIESVLSRAEIIDPTTLSGDTIKFGASVKLSNDQSDEEVTYQIVGAPEADIKAGTIAVTAPLARALIGKQVGDEVKVGPKTYEILEIAFR